MCGVHLFKFAVITAVPPGTEGLWVWIELPDKLSSSGGLCVLVKGTGAARTLLVSPSPCFSNRMLLIFSLRKRKYPLHKASSFFFDPPTTYSHESFRI